MRIAIVGPCGAGKTTLADRLQALGLNARQIAQEHSFVPAMWQLITKPDVLIYLHASFETCQQRKQLAWRPQDYAKQLRRLKHAREHCQISVETDGLSPDEILARVLNELGIGQDSSRML